MNKKLLTCALALSAAMASFAQTHVMDVNTKKAGATVQNTMYGLFSKTSTMPLTAVCTASW